MRNKGFFWFLTILLTAVCLYQLSFTWVSTNVENKSIKEANERVLALKKEAASTNNIGVLPNNTSVDFSKPESMELAKAAFINQILKEKAENKVYPIFGSTFSETKKRSLAFGLDLVGGMSVTLEISLPDLVMNYELDKVLSVKVYKARLAGLDSCRVGLAMTIPGSFVYLGVPV